MHRHRIDPALAPVGPLDPDEGAVLTGGVVATDVTTPGDGEAIGQAGFVERTPDDPLALWGRLRTHSLRIRLGAGDVGISLNRLLDRWIAGIGPTTVEPGDSDSSLTVAVPSRDLRFVAPLQAHHFTASTNLSVRIAGSPSAVPPRVPSHPPAVGGAGRVRTATEADLPALGRMAVELQLFDAQVGTVTARDGALATLTRGIADRWREEPDLTLVYDDGDAILGFTQLSNPSQDPWASGSYVDPPSAAYLASQYVAPAARGTGIGGVLVDAAHAVVDHRGWTAILLHHATANPLSSVFWARHGYRPLVTSWFRSPALPPPVGERE